MALVYFEKTVRYTVGGRRFVGDPQGFILNNEIPWIGIKEEDLRDFKIANKRIITEGLIKQTVEPDVDWATPNTYDDAELDVILKSSRSLKNSLETINSIATVARLLERAKDQNKSAQMVEMLEDKLEEVNDEEINLDDVQRALDA